MVTLRLEKTDGLAAGLGRLSPLPVFQPYVGAWRAGAPMPALDFVSLGMIVSGYFVSIAATEALGIDGTCEKAL